jgi:hypothetical protein
MSFGGGGRRVCGGALEEHQDERRRNRDHRGAAQRRCRRERGAPCMRRRARWARRWEDVQHEAARREPQDRERQREPQQQEARRAATTDAIPEYTRSEEALAAKRACPEEEPCALPEHESGQVEEERLVPLGVAVELVRERPTEHLLAHVVGEQTRADASTRTRRRRPPRMRTARPDRRAARAVRRGARRRRLRGAAAARPALRQERQPQATHAPHPPADARCTDPCARRYE